MQIDVACIRLSMNSIANVICTRFDSAALLFNEYISRILWECFHLAPVISSHAHQAVGMSNPALGLICRNNGQAQVPELHTEAMCDNQCDVALLHVGEVRSSIRMHLQA